MTEIPVSVSNCSRVGIRPPLMSMYSGQLEKTSSFSSADLSVLLQLSAVCFCDSVPQADSSVGDPSARADSPAPWIIRRRPTLCIAGIVRLIVI